MAGRFLTTHSFMAVDGEKLMNRSDLLYELYRAPICGYNHIPYAYC